MIRHQAKLDLTFTNVDLTNVRYQTVIIVPVHNKHIYVVRVDQLGHPPPLHIKRNNVLLANVCKCTCYSRHKLLKLGKKKKKNC